MAKNLWIERDPCIFSYSEHCEKRCPSCIGRLQSKCLHKVGEADPKSQFYPSIPSLNIISCFQNKWRKCNCRQNKSDNSECARINKCFHFFHYRNIASCTKEMMILVKHNTKGHKRTICYTTNFGLICQPQKNYEKASIIDS